MTRAAASPDPFVSVSAAAAFLDVKVAWLYDNLRTLGIPHVRFGRGLRFRLSELEAWADGRRETSAL